MLTRIEYYWLGFFLDCWRLLFVQDKMMDCVKMILNEKGILNASNTL